MKPSADEVYAVNATVKALDKLDSQYLKHPGLKLACRAARAAFVKALAEAQASPSTNSGPTDKKGEKQP